MLQKEHIYYDMPSEEWRENKYRSYEKTKWNPWELDNTSRMKFQANKKETTHKAKSMG